MSQATPTIRLRNAPRGPCRSGNLRTLSHWAFLAFLLAYSHDEYALLGQFAQIRLLGEDGEWRILNLWDRLDCINHLFKLLHLLLLFLL